METWQFLVLIGAIIIVGIDNHKSQLKLLNKVDDILSETNQIRTSVVKTDELGNPI